MDLDSFKTTFEAELAGLTPARVTTLWKKSASLSRAEMIDAIAHSRAAQSKDRQRRGLGSDAPSQIEPKPSAQVDDSAAPAPADAVVAGTAMSVAGAVDARHVALPDWSPQCESAKIDLNVLSDAVNAHVQTILSKKGDADAKLARLFDCVEQLLALRIRAGDGSVDVIATLRAARE